LTSLASTINNAIPSPYYIATLIGLASAIVDNIPLVLATMGMYDLSQYPVDSNFWQLIAYCAGTGGSILIIGSAAGVVFMGIDKVDFFSYVKRISLAATVGYFVGIGVYLLV
jgi:Na+/H+ antiporter NhaD/arsenite permease-like protein